MSNAKLITLSFKLNELIIDTSAKFYVKCIIYILIFFSLRPCSCCSFVAVESKIQRSRLGKWHWTKWEHSICNRLCDLGVVAYIHNPSTEETKVCIGHLAGNSP